MKLSSKSLPFRDDHKHYFFSIKRKILYSKFPLKLVLIKFKLQIKSLVMFPYSILFY